MAGVTLHFTLGENGIIRNAEIAGEKYKEAQAREKLETTLAYAMMQKNTSSEYNRETLNNILTSNNIQINENIVTVDGYSFIMDLDQLKILEELGKTQVSIKKEVKKYIGKKENDKYYVNAEISIQSVSEIESIHITAEDGTNIEITPELTTASKEVELEIGKKYKVTTITKDGKEDTKTLIESKEETLNTAKELAEFRDKVNTGLTYEGKTINLGRNIDLSSVCGRNVNGKEISWEPIGDNRINNVQGEYFKGTFDGKYKAISNLYININQPDTSGRQSIGIGLFGENSGTIQNLIIENAYVYYNTDILNSSTEWQYVGIILGSNSSGIVKNCGINSGEITGVYSSKSAYIQGFFVGGLVGSSSGTIENCYNKAKVYGQGDNSKKSIFVGGISGDTEWAGETKNCYNIGEIVVGGIAPVICGGVLGQVSVNNALIKNSYNIKEITVLEGTNIKYLGGIVGQVTLSGIMQNSYCTDNFTVSYYKNTTAQKGEIVAESTLKGYASILNEKDEEENEIEVWVEDTTKINNGYPILKWQIEH